MTTAPPRSTVQPASAAPPRTLPVRPARRRDAAALAALSRPFVRSGALRERPLSHYASDAADFLVVDAPDGTLAGCLGLRAHPADPANDRPAAGVLYNFCVAPASQGRGIGAALLRSAVARARSRSLGSLFTATTGSGDLFLRHGFAPARASRAPVAWADALDPRRDARVLARSL